MRIAITRPVGEELGSCQLTHLERRPIDLALARRQHAAYEAALAELGCRVERLVAEPGLPDAVFIEDAAVVLDELAIITRPGAASRRGETAAVAAALAPYRPLRSIDAPATLDGGDVVRLGRELWVGRSRRTNPAGIEQLRSIAAGAGYRVRDVPVEGCLHLKSAVTAIGEDRLLINPRMTDAGAFGGRRLIEVDPAEPLAANVLAIGERVITAAHQPRTNRRLESAGVRLRRVELSELAKAEGGVTCCSLLVEAAARGETPAPAPGR